MGGVKVTGPKGEGLAFTATLNIEDVKAKKAELKKLMSDLAVTSDGVVKTLNAQKITAESVAASIKQANLARAEANAITAKEKASQTELNTKIKQNALARQEEAAATRAQAAAAKEAAAQSIMRPPTQFSNSQAEISAYQNLANGSREVTTTLNEQNLAEAALANSVYENTTATNANADATKKQVLSKKELELQAVRDKLVLAENTAAIKLQAREMNAAKGSLDQRRAALARLQTVFDGLNAAERNSAYGVRLQGVVSGLSTQVKELEASTGRAQRNVGNYGSVFSKAASTAWGWLRKIGLLLPGISTAGILAFAVEPVINYISSLNLFSDRLNQAVQNLKALNEVMVNANKAAGTQIGALRELYDAATNTNKSFKERIAAAEQLRDSYAAEFQNATDLEIVNGKLKGSYDELTDSIIAMAKAQASSAKIAEIEGKNLDDQFQIDKNNAVKAAQNAKALADYKVQLAHQSAASAAATAAGQATYRVDGNVFLTPAAKLKELNRQIKDETDQSNLIPTQNIALRDKTVKFLEGYVKNVSKSTSDLKDANKLLGDQLQNFDNLISGVKDKKQINNIQAALQAKLNALAPNDKQRADLENKLRQVEAIEKKYAPKVNDGKAAANAEAESQKAKLHLLQQVSEATEKFNRNALSADQAALTAVSDKFDQLRNRIAAFNADPRNKNHQIETSVITNLNLQEFQAQTDQANLNENEFIKQDIEKKKKLYADYEEYRLRAGSTAANAEYSDLLKSGKDFATYLDNIKKGAAETFTYISTEFYSGFIKTGNDTSGPISDRIAFTQKQIDENTEAQKKAYQELLAATSTYAQERQAIIETALADEKELNATGHADQAKQVRKDLADRLLSLDEEQFRELDAYRYLFNNIDQLSEESAKKQINDLYGIAAVQLATGKITLAAYLAIVRNLDQANLKIKDKFPDELKAIGQGFADIGNQVSGFDEALGNALNTAGSLVSAVGDIKSNLNNISNSTVSTVSKISSGLGIIGTAVGIFSTIYSLFDHSKEAAEQAAYAAEIQLKEIEAVNKGLERQLQLTKEIQGPERLASYKKDLADIAAAQANAQEQINKRHSLTGDKGSDAIIASGPDNPLYAQVIYEATKAGASISLANKSLKEYQDLLYNGKLDQNTASLVQSLVDLDQQYKDTSNALNEEITGINFDDLKDSIKAVFESGKTDAQSFADAIEKSIRTAFANAFERNEIDNALQPFYDELAKAGGDGTFTAEEIAQLRNMKTSISDALAVKAKAYQEIIGPDTTTTDQAKTPTGQIAPSLTEDTATRIYGVLAGTQLAAVQIKDLLTVQGKSIGDLYQTAIGSFGELVKIQVNTRRTADNTDVLPEMLNQMKAISKNTSDSAGTLLRAQGKLGW